MVDLLSNPNNRFAIPTNCLFGILTEIVLFVKRVLIDFIAEYAPALNALTKDLNTINSLLMFYNKQQERKTYLSFQRVFLSILSLNLSFGYSREK